jgi:hypothetical protein
MAAMSARDRVLDGGRYMRRFGECRDGDIARTGEYDAYMAFFSR